MIGTRVGSYQITETLGEGGMGAVYIAQHTMLGKKAAVKLLLPELSKNEQIVQRFFNEARAATMIHHKGIIEVFDFGYTADGNAFIVMELLKGEALTDRIRARKQVPEQEIYPIIRQAAKALAAAHEAQIVHRDLKPDNIFLCPDEEVVGGERVKVLDFGIAKLTADAMSGAQKTRTGSVMGSPAYMSPEQCRGLSTIDLRADIYSLGCVIHQMATGRVPFVGEGVGDIIAKHIYEPPPNPRDLSPNITVGLADIIARCMAKEPEARFQSMTELVAAIDAASAGAWATGRSQSGRAVTSDPIAQTVVAGQEPSGAHTTLGGSAAQVVTAPVTETKRSKAPIFAALAVAAAGAVVGVVLLGGGNKGKSESTPQPAAATAVQPETASQPDEKTTKQNDADKVFFVISSEPKGAEVYRMPGGILVGSTPFEEWKAPTEGKVVFLVKKAGFQDQRVVIDATDGGSKKLALVSATPAAKPVETIAAKKSKRRSKKRSSKRAATAKTSSAKKQPATKTKTTKTKTDKPSMWAD